MIRVTVELLPFGAEEGKRTLGVMHIANDGSGGPYVGNYNVRVYGGGDSQYRRVLYGTEGSRVEGFQRKTRSAWELVRLALGVVAGKRTASGRRL